jgi:hypothetical protein
MPCKSNPFGLPWWVLIGAGGVGVYLLTRPKKSAADSAKKALGKKKTATVDVVPTPTMVTLSKLQDLLAQGIADAIGFKKESLIVNIKSATGPVTVVDRRNKNTVLTSNRAPDDLLKLVDADKLDKYYVDPFGATSLYDHGWIASPIKI